MPFIATEDLDPSVPPGGRWTVWRDLALCALLVCAVALPLIGLLMSGFFTLQPNEARVLILFGDYKGTVTLTASVS